MKRILALLMFAVPALGQVSYQPQIKPVQTDPSGTTPCTLPWYYNSADGTAWYPSLPSAGSCTWTQLSGNGGPIPPGWTCTGSGTGQVCTAPGTFAAGATVSSKLSIQLAATGSSDDVPINTVIGALSAIGGGDLYLLPGAWSLSNPVVPKNNVRIYGVQPGLTNYDGHSNDYWTFSGTGTVLTCTSSAKDGIAANTTPNASGSSYFASNAVYGAGIFNLGITGCNYGIHIGAVNSPGLYNSRVSGVYLEGNASWGIDLENMSQDEIGGTATGSGIYATGNTVGDMRFASTVDSGYFISGNTRFHNLYSSPGSAFSKGVLFTAPGADGTNPSILNYVVVDTASIVRASNGTLVTQTVTPTSSSTSIAVTDLTKFQVGLPVTFSTTADGFTATQTYFIYSVSGSSGSGTISVANTEYAASAITATGSTPITIEYYGANNLEVVANSQTSPVSNVTSSTFGGLDLEGYQQCAIYAEYSNSITYTVSTASLSGFQGLCARGASTNTLNTNASMSGDLQSGSNAWTWNGQRGTMLPGNGANGVMYDSVIGNWGLELGQNSGNNPDLYISGPNGTFLVPYVGIGETIRTRNDSGSVTFSASQAGDVVYNVANTPSISLPVIDSGSNRGATYQGASFTLVNASTTNPLTVSTQSSQTFNNISGLTSISIPENSSATFVGSKTSTGSVLFWQCRPTYICVPAPTVIVGTSGTATCVTTFLGYNKMASCYLNGYANTGTAQTYTYAGGGFSTSPNLAMPVGWTYTASTSATVLTLPANALMTAVTGEISVLLGQ